MKRKHVIFLNRFFYPDESATSALLTDLAFSLAESGIAVTVITGRSHYKSSAEKLPRSETRNGIVIARLPTLLLDQASLLGRILNFLIFYVGSFFALVRVARKGDLVICLTDPPLAALPAFWAARLRSARFANWIQDIFPETAAVLGYTTGFGWISDLLRRLRNRVWRQSDCNIVIGARMRDYLAAAGAPPDKIRLLPNWIDEQEVSPSQEPAIELRRLWNLDPDDFVVMYSGNLGRAHDVGAMVEAIRILERRQPHRIRFVFVGGGARTEIVREFARSESVASVQFVEFQKKEHLAKSLSVGDIHWMSLIPQLEGYIVPSKFYGATAVGRPVIFVGDRRGEIADLIGRFHCGAAFEPHQSLEIADWVWDASTNPSTCHDMGERARELATTWHARSRRLDEWQQLVRSLASRN